MMVLFLQPTHHPKGMIADMLKGLPDYAQCERLTHEERCGYRKWWTENSHEVVSAITHMIRHDTQEMEEFKRRQRLYAELRAEYGNDPAPTPEQRERCIQDYATAQAVLAKKLR